MKNLLKIGSYTLELLFFLIIFFVYAIRTGTFQTWITQLFASYLSHELNTEIHIDKIYVHFLNELSFNNLYIEDLHGDTLIFASDFSLELNSIHFKSQAIHIDNMTLNNARFKLIVYHGDTINNMQFLVDYFSSTDTTTSPPWEITSDELSLVNAHFSYNDLNIPDTLHCIDYGHIDASNANLLLENFKFEGDTIYANIERLSLCEKNGFKLDSLHAHIKYSPVLLIFDSLFIYTPRSSIVTDLSFSYDSIGNFTDFVHLVKIKNTAQSIALDLTDLAQFVPIGDSINTKIYFKGKISGHISHLKGKNIELTAGNNTKFKGRIDLNGLPDITKTAISLIVNEFTTDAVDIDSLLKFFVTPEQFSISKLNLQQLKTISFNGSFMGFINDFVAYGDLNTAIGGVSTDLSFSKDSSGIIVSDGRLATRKLNLGVLLNTNNFGSITADVDIHSSGTDFSTFKTRIEGGISSLNFNNYNYSNIIVIGDIAKNLFHGFVYVRDKNIDMNFDGVLDFRGKVPEYSFNSDIQNGNLAKLHFIDRDSSSSLCLAMKANITGNNLDNINGKLALTQVSYFEKDIEYNLGDFLLRSEYFGDIKSLYIESDIADLTVSGKFNFEELPASMTALVANILPSYNINESAIPNTEQLFDFELVLENANPITKLFSPGTTLSNNSILYGQFNSTTLDFNLSGLINQININDTQIKDFSFDIEKVIDILYLKAQASTVSFSDSLSFNKTEFSAIARQDGIETVMKWDNNTSDSWGKIEGYGNVISASKFTFDLYQSEVRAIGSNWIIDEGTSFTIDSSAIDIHGFEICNGNQSILVNGKITENPDDQLDIYFDHFNLNVINPLIAESGLQLHGTLIGGGYLANLYHNPFFSSDIVLNDMKLNDEYIGNLYFNNFWDNELKKITFNGRLKEFLTSTINFGGDFYPLKSANNVDLTLSLNDANLKWLNSILPKDVSKFKGYATGDLQVTGTFGEPKIDGKLSFTDAGIKVNLLNTAYTFSGSVLLDSKEEMIALDYIPIADENNQKGWANATFYHHNFSDFNYDIYLEIDSMLCLNTTKKMNSTYYGKAVASGSVNIYNDFMNNVVVDVNASTKKGTLLNIPLSGTENVEVQNFVHFLKNDTISKKKEVDLTGINLNFELDVSPEAKIRLIFDEKIGDIMQGRGLGHISMLISTGGKFEMYGQFEVTEGDYLFTFQNTFSKHFSVKPGGTISWYGDPYGADLDLIAVYSLQTSLVDLMPNNDEKYKKPIPVEVEMHLSNSLLSPDIGFGINLPKTDESTRSYVNSLLNTSQEMNMQVFSLLLLRKFMKPSNGIVDADPNRGSGIGNSGIEMLNQQVNELLSRVSNDFDIGLNYTPGDKISNNELALALSTQALNGRLTISGNFGVSNAPQTQNSESASSIIGDFNLDYLINEQGTLRLHAYNETNEYNPTSKAESNYTQGAGINYVKDFNDIDDLIFLQKSFDLFRKCENKKMIKCKKL